MIATAVVDIRGRRTWDTGLLTEETFTWPTDAPLVPLRELTTQVVSSVVAQSGAQVITPAGLDAVAGGIRRRTRRYQGSAFQVMRDVQIGDVLVPPGGDAPALLVNDALRGALVSSRFAAMRPVDRITPLWLWAVLNSESGHDVRRRLALGASDRSGAKLRLLDLAVPVPPLVRQREVEPALRAVESMTHIDEEEAPSTWWRLTTLRGNEWRLMLASPTPELLEDGIQLGALAERIDRGAVIGPDQMTHVAGAGTPVIDHAALVNGFPKRWAEPRAERAVTATPTDVLVAANGNRAYAIVARETSFVDRNVIRIRLKEARHANAIVNHLNGSTGYSHRQMLLRGSTVPHMSVADLSRIPVPSAIFAADDGKPLPSLPLSEQLERVLWQT